MKKFLLPLLLIVCLLAACAPKESPAAELTATVTIDCLPLLDSPELVSEKTLPLIPDNHIFSEKEISFSQGTSAYDVLIRVMQEDKLHYEADSSKYIFAIGNIYSGDCGSMSGWLYEVNGESPMVGAKDYVLSDGDHVRMYYTAEMVWDD